MTKEPKRLAKVLEVYKPIGQTPLQAIEEVRKAKPELMDVSITYAGRLDPMAEGLLLLLVGEEVYKKEEYLALEKEYIFEMLCGFSTDTFDILGLMQDTQACVLGGQKLKDALVNFVGTQTQEYPPYSSKTVDGKPLFQWAREGRISEIEIPVHDIHISELECLEMSTISAKKLQKMIVEKIALVHGDFRQEEIKRLWSAYIDTLVTGLGQKEFSVARMRTVCSSGTYVRSLVHDIGMTLDVPTVTLSIKRMRVGKYVLKYPTT